MKKLLTAVMAMFVLTAFSPLAMASDTPISDWLNNKTSGIAKKEQQTTSKIAAKKKAEQEKAAKKKAKLAEKQKKAQAKQAQKKKEEMLIAKNVFKVSDFKTQKKSFNERFEKYINFCENKL